MPHDHPLRPIHTMADKALKERSPVFRELYATVGTAFDPAGKAASFAAVADFILHPQ